MNPDEEITLLSDPVWTDKYEQEEQRVRAVAGEGLLGVHHVGSTAMPDVPGKPALDVLVAFDSFERFSESDTSILVINWADDHAVFHRRHTIDDEDKIKNPDYPPGLPPRSRRRTQGVRENQA